MIGRIIGNYQITSELAQGGMGAVYRGRHLHLPREVVVKAILLGAFSPSAQVHLKARFRREAYIQSQLDHPNLVRVYEFFAAEENYYLVMEYVPGLSLRDLLARQGVPTPEQVVYLCKQALAALDYAHNFSYVDESDIGHTGVIHRDLKPANLLLDPKGKLKMTDFGIVKVLGEPGPGAMTQTGFHPGTVEYMSPEQLLGLEIDVRSDLYSLGVTFYELLTGRLPFPRSSTGSDWEVRKGHIEMDPPPVLELRPDTPAALAAIITRALLKNPHERFQTAAEFLEALQNYEQRHDERQTGRVPAVKLTRSHAVPTLIDDAAPARASGALPAPWEEAATLPMTQSRASVPTASAPLPARAELPTLPQTHAPQRHWPLLAAAAGLLLVGGVSGAFLFSSQAEKSKPQARVARLEATPAVTATTTPTLALAKPKAAAPQALDNSALKRARQFEQDERYAEAIQNYEEYLRRNPIAPDARIVSDSLVALRQFQGLMTAANTAMEMRRYPAARLQYTEALKLRPTSAAARAGLTEAEAKLTAYPRHPITGSRMSGIGGDLPPRGQRKPRRAPSATPTDLETAPQPPLQPIKPPYRQPDQP